MSKASVRRVVLLTDTHWQAGEAMHPAYLAVKTFIKAWRPDQIVHLGDISDWSFIARFNEHNLREIEGKRFRSEYDVIERELDDLQRVTPDLTLLLGNHDERVYTFIDKAPMLDGFVGFEDALRLKARGIPMFHETEQPFKIGKLNAIHGWYCNKYHANKHLDVYSGNVVYGHVHRFQTFSRVLAAHKQEIEARSLGCLCDKAPEWMDGIPTGWQHGFAVVYVLPNGDFQLYTINIIRNHFVFEGRQYGPGTVTKI